MAQYNTQQKKALVDFLTLHAQTPYTIEELVTQMQCDSTLISKPGKSTVYRLMAGLVEEGYVKRFVKGESRQFVYQIVGCQDAAGHLHMKCEECGKLFHLESKQSERILKEILSSDDFEIDKSQTVIYGKCSECKK